MPPSLAESTARAALERALPEPLLRHGPLDLAWWQWIAIPLAAVIAVLLGKVAGYLSRRVLTRLVARTATQWDDALVERLAAPFTAVWALAAAYLLKLPLGLSRAAEAGVDRALRVAAVVVFFWAGVRAIDLGFQALAATPRARALGLELGLVPMLRKASKIGVVSMAVIAVLTDLGYPVASLLAGLGIGGLALALAAQKTVENLFGSVSISVDRPFQVGDFVRIEGDLMGTVEALGLRSTRLRTLDRTLVTIPNGRLADQRIETFAARDRCRLSCTLGLVYDTTAAQMRAVVAGIDRVLREHPRVWPDGIGVRFVAFSACSLDVEVVAWFQTGDWNEFKAIRQELLFAFLEEVERAGTRFAFPTQTVHLTAERPVDPDAAAPRPEPASG